MDDSGDHTKPHGGFPPPTDNQAKLLWLAASAVAVTVLVAVLCLMIWGVGRVLAVMSPVLWPLAVAGVLAYLLDPVVDFLERRAVPRTRAILVVFVCAATLLLGVLGSVIPAVVNETRELIQQVDTYSSRVERWVSQPPAVVHRLLKYLPGYDGTTPSSGSLASATNAEPVAVVAVVAVEPDAAPVSNAGPAEGEEAAMTVGSEPVASDPAAEEAAESEAAEATDVPLPLWESLIAGGHLKSATSIVAKGLLTVGGWILGEVTKVASWFGVLAGLALIPVYLFYLLLEKAGIQSQWTTYLPVRASKFKEELVFVLSSINEYLIAFFRGQVLVAICDGILYTIGFLLIGLPMAVLIGVAAVFLTIIPYIGAIVICGTALLVAAVHFGDLLHPMLVLLVFAFVQGLEGFLIQPKIVGDRVGLHPLTIIIALMVGTVLFGGLLGGILAIPFTAALRVVMFRYIWRQEGSPARKGGKPRAKRKEPKPA